MQMMTWQRATRKHMTRQRRRITGGHVAHRIRGVTSRICSNIGRSLPGSPWSIMKLTNTRRPLKGKHNHNDNETKKRVRIGYCFAKFLFFSLNENIPISQIRLPSLRSERRTVADASVAFLEDGEGEGDSAKSEMMVASSIKLILRGSGVL